MHLALATHIHNSSNRLSILWLNKEGDCHKQSYCSIGTSIKDPGQLPFVCQLLFRRQREKK